MIAVACDHALRWPTGGFLGVDIFFVISGFLITSLFLSEVEATGRLSLRRFYGRRVRRLLPAATVVLAATTGVGYLLFNDERARQTLWDAIFAFAISANYRFAAEGTNYFHSTNATSPLQHFWSLSVEEQFYLIWPILLIVIVALTARRSSIVVVRWTVGLVSVALVALSFAVALEQSVSDPTLAYFSTTTRAWQLASGAVLAAAVPVLARMPAIVRYVLGWGGLAGLLASLVLIDSTMSVPAPWAALPVAATACVIAGGVGGPQRHLYPLTNPVSVFIGDISYSLYLWHLPVIVLLPLVLDSTSPWYLAIVFGAILLLSLSSYFVIEDPIRHSPLFAGEGDRAQRSEAWMRWRDTYAKRFVQATFGALGFGLVALVITGTLIHNGARFGTAAVSANASQQAESAVELRKELVAQLAAAASAESWPTNLSPSLDQAIADTSTTNPANNCFAPGNTPDVSSCTWGSQSAPHHMYLVGDSIALAYAPAFKAIAEQSGGQWQITTIGLYGCRFTSQLVHNDGAGVMDACQQRKDDVAARIAADSPQVVVIANAFTLGNSESGTPLSVADLTSGAGSEAARYGSAHIVYLAPPPTGADLGQCYTKVSTPQSCNVSVSQTWSDFAAATKAVAKKGGDHYVSSLEFSCVDNICPAFAGTLPIRYDSVHLVPAYAEHIAPLIRRALVAQKLM